MPVKKSSQSCVTCGAVVYRTRTEIARSKSGNYFCGKSCQTVWRNKQFSGAHHKNWQGGAFAYRTIIRKKGDPVRCTRCLIDDLRVLAVHHQDENHGNNDPENLMWLCHNCHYLTHIELRRLKAGA